MKMKNDLSFMIGNTLNLYDCSPHGTMTFTVLNINRGHNLALMEKCHRLWEYSEFSSEIEENIRNGMRREEAVHTAIDTCIEKGILKDILIKQKAEVLHMILTEYDEKKHFRTLFREGRERGREERGEEFLRDLIKKKLDKGKSIPESAEDLEEEISVIQRLIDNPVSDIPNELKDYLSDL